MKKIFTLLLLIFVLCPAGQAMTVSNNMEKQKAVEARIDEIRQSQKLEKGQAIDCVKVTARQLEELGDAVIDAGDIEERDLIDKVLGGDDSQVDQAYHRIIGAQYLGCFKDGYIAKGFPDGSNMNGWMPGMSHHENFRFKAMRIFFGTVALVLLSLIFSVIFWITYRWVAKYEQKNGNIKTVVKGRRKNG